MTDTLASTSTATKETLEDYTLRFAPRHYRRWPTGVVAVSALGGIAYLADFAIGANIGIAYGTMNAPGASSSSRSRARSWPRASSSGWASRSGWATRPRRLSSSRW